MPIPHHPLRRALTLIALIAFALSTAACGDELGSISFTEESGESVVEGSANPLNMLLPAEVFPPLRLNINLQQELDAQNATGAKAVNLRALKLKITDTERPSGDTDDFDFLSKATLYVESTKSGTTLERKQIATIDPVPSGQTEVAFDVDDSVDLKPYIEEGMRLTSSGSGSVPPDNVSLKAEITVRVRLL